MSAELLRNDGRKGKVLILLVYENTCIMNHLFDAIRTRI